MDLKLFMLVYFLHEQQGTRSCITLMNFSPSQLCVHRETRCIAWKKYRRYTDEVAPAVIARDSKLCAAARVMETN